jgi:plastocyanin
MKRLYQLGIGLILIGCVGTSGGGAWAYEGGAVANGGSISGTIKISGAVKPAPLEVNKDQKVCGKTKPDESLVVGDGNVLANAVVRLTNIKKGKALDTSTKVVLDQKECRFTPHIVVVPVGATLDIKNSDPITHNVHTFGFENDPINKAQPSSLPVIPATFDYPEMIKTRCDIHKWMGAWIVTTDHPYVALTDAKGAFKLADVPAGTYKLEIWHESTKKVTQDVTVKAGVDAAVMVELKAK